MLVPGRGVAMNSTIDEINLLRQAQRHHLVVRGIGEEIDLEIGPGEDDPTFATTLVRVPTQDTGVVEEQEDHKQLIMASQAPSEDQTELVKLPQAKRKKKVVKKWREEWADTYKWAYVDVHEGTTRIFCSVCREYGRKHRRNPYGNEGSRNMQMSALEEHNNSLLHKEALRLQLASKDKGLPAVERPVFVKGQCVVYCRDFIVLDSSTRVITS
ncbi:putative transcription factor and/or regulators TTF-type(Zn) family [Dioscorea sansibarensis]